EQAARQDQGGAATWDLHVVLLGNKRRGVWSSIPRMAHQTGDSVVGSKVPSSTCDKVWRFAASLQ
ncbi:hypothetical protein, partial [Pseudomonas putida]|uniref:hypothetical protein n=1 Tax=Pseudomonas putida TaxID=303 RepID=UPI001955346F